MSSLIKIIENLDKYRIFSKQSIIAAILIILFIVFNPFIKVFISEWLVFKSNDIEPSYLFDFIIGIIFFLGGLFVWHKIQIAYRASFLHYLFLGIIILPYWVYRLSDVDWEYLKIKLLHNNTIAYLDVVMILLMFYPIFMLLKVILIFSKRKEDEDQPSRTIFVEDTPIKNDKDDKLGYKNIISKILNPIIKDSYKKAFTIGLVGPWGNGKSSLLGLFKEELKKENIKNIIEVEFSPFLNHNEKDIISDFFDALCDKLKRYDGTLHKDISNYSDALLKLYKTGNIASLLDLNIDVDKSLPVYDLYNKIDTSLGKINKKIIVYVDDLDRLNPIEISETLKLIRNTANFTNTVFIIALDKDYVIKTLKGDNSNKHYKFLEKFFQLEVYLPKIPQKILREEFIEILKKSNDFDESDIVLINNALTNNRNLFNRFIHNIRDVKRLVNQLIFESKFVFKEVDTNDYLNFIFLKINFPRFIQLLNERKEDFLQVKDGRFFLIENLPDDNNEELSSQRIKDIINKSNSFIVDYKKYKISTVFNPQDENCFKSVLGIDCIELELLLSVLVALFGERNNLPHNSIQFERNFYKVMRLSFAEDDLRESDFTQIITTKNDEQTFYDYLEKLLLKKLGEQLITRIDYHEVKNKQELLSISKTLFYFWRRLDNYNLYLSEITRLLSKYLNIKNNVKLISEDVKLTQGETKEIVKNEFLDNEYVDLSKKVRLLALLKENEYETGLWGLTDKELNGYSIKYYKEYLALHQDKMWGLTDFTFYSIYHQLKTISNQTELNNLLINYLKTVNIEVFCSQTLELEPFSTLSYGVSEFVVELFGNYLAFKTFLLDHKSSQTRGIQEYLKFYELLLICSFRYRRKFIFKEFTVQDYTKKHGKISEYDRSVAEKLVQIHLVFDKSLENFKPNLDIVGFKFVSNYFLYEGKTYLFFSTTQANETECLQSIFNSLKSSLVDFKDEAVILKSDWKNLTAQLQDKEGKNIIEILTVQYGK